MAADIMELEASGVASVLVVTQPFKSLAENALKFRKFEEVPVHILPHPTEARPDEEIRALADKHVPEILQKVQKPRAMPDAQP